MSQTSFKVRLSRGVLPQDYDGMDFKGGEQVYFFDVMFEEGAEPHAQMECQSIVDDVSKASETSYPARLFLRDANDNFVFPYTASIYDREPEEWGQTLRGLIIQGKMLPADPVRLGGICCSGAGTAIKVREELTQRGYEFV